MLIIANWKMNCLKAEAEKLVSSVKAGDSGKNEVVLCTPFTLVATVAQSLANTKIKAGAQDCSEKESGAYTGDVSAAMLADTGAEYVIVGHSERRKHHNESNELIKNKATLAIKAKLIPIICIGETGEERKAGKTRNIIIEQIESCIPDNKDIIIAYEPVWAIGTGITPNNSEIEEAHALILSKLPGVKILYGGSVNEQNCTEIAGIPNVSGFLVGGASLDAAKFVKIMNV